MSAPDEYLRYPHRRRGLDHHWFTYQPVKLRKRLAWPGGARVALWITVPVEFFPMDAPAQPLRPVGAVDRAYPDFWTYSNRDYGNRIGIFRIMHVLERFGLKATAAMNSDIATRYPPLLDRLLKADWEIMAHGVNMAQLHYGGVAREVEAAMIDKALTVLRRESGRSVRGWHSPGHSQSMNTLDLLAEAGVEYVADWINDDLPYDVQTAGGSLCALPLTYEWSDRTLLAQQNMTITDYERQVLNAFRCLDEEAAEHGGRVLSLSVSPWIMGYPHRIQGLVRVIDAILKGGSVWPASGGAMMDEFRRQAG